MLGQEFAHRWLAFLHYKDQNGNLSSNLLGRDQAAYLLDGLFNKVKPTGFEQLSARDMAQLLQISESAAAKRYIRAVERLRTILIGLGALVFKRRR